MSEIPSFIGVCGLPSDTDVVEVSGRAEAILIRQGWIPPREEPCVICGHGMETISTHWACERALLEDVS